MTAQRVIAAISTLPKLPAADRTTPITGVFATLLQKEERVGVDAAKPRKYTSKNKVRPQPRQTGISVAATAGCGHAGCSESSGTGNRTARRRSRRCLLFTGGAKENFFQVSFGKTTAHFIQCAVNNLPPAFQNQDVRTDLLQQMQQM